MRKSTRPYVGLSIENHRIKRTYFRTVGGHTFDNPAINPTNGKPFTMIVGPFNTAHAAKFHAAHAEGNPHTQCVADSERVARLFRQLPDGSFQKK